MLAKCPTCNGPVLDTTAEQSELEHGRSAGCLMCGRRWFERREPPRAVWQRGQPGRPRKAQEAS